MTPEEQALFDRLFGGAGAAAGAALAYKGYEDLGEIGERAFGEFAGPGGLAERIGGMLEFQPYTVTTATGGQFGMTQDPVTGEMQYGIQMSPEEQEFQRRRFEQSGMFFDQAAVPVAEREQQVFDRMMTAMSPSQERERLALEQRLAAQGRLGTQTAAFGGTPEALTLAKAQEEARNQAILQAMEFAGTEQMRQSQLGTGMLGASYVPQAQLLSAITPGMTAAEQRRAALSEQAKSYGETYAAGLNALLSAGLGQANIAGGFGSSLAEGALGGLFKT
jgi:hypothetical protein